MRINRTRLCWQLVLGTIAHFLWTDAAACSCVPRQTSHYYAKADVVIVGEVISTNEADLEKEGRNYVRRAVVRVEDMLKGESARTVTVEVRSGTCSLFLQKKSRAVLFLDKTLQVDQCLGSKVLYSDDDLRKFFGLKDEEIRTYKVKVQVLLKELHDLTPKKWWQIWR